MAFIGNAPASVATNFQGVVSDSFNGTGSQTDFTLTRSVASVAWIEVLVDNVQQSPYDGSYSVTGTTLSFSGAPPSGTNNVYVVYRDQPLASIIDSTAYRQTEVDTLLDAKVSKAGDTMTGTLQSTVNNGRAYVSNAWAEMSGGSGGTALFGSNAYTHFDGVSAITHKYSQSHAGIGATAVLLNHPGWNKGALVTAGTTSSTADQSFTPINALIWDEAGRVTMPYQPAFSAYTNIQKDWNSGAFAPVVFELTRYNIGNHYNTSNGIFTAPVAGKYWVNSWIMWMGESSFTFMFLAPQVNGIAMFEFMRQGDRGDYSTFGGGMTLDLAANDQVRIAIGLASVDSGYLRAGSTMNQFEIRLVS